jgi:hypothetical protein
MANDVEIMRRRYATLPTEALRDLACEADQLTPDARLILDEEIARRGEHGRRDAVDSANSVQSGKRDHLIAERLIGRNRIAIGLASFAVGAFVTAASYEAAFNRGGGYYVVASGALFYGVIQIVRGVAGLLSSNSPLQPTGRGGG